LTKKEKTSRDIVLTFDFLRQLIDNPKILDKIPSGCTIEFVDKDFPQLERASRQMTINTVKKKYLRVKTHLEII
jgi:hypothetical protein